MAYEPLPAPEAARIQVEAIVRSLRETLGAPLVGVYLHGSLAMGSFQPERSDLDLVAVYDGEVPAAAKAMIATELLGLSGAPHPIELHICKLADLHPWRHPCPFAFHYSEGWRGSFEAALAEGGDGAVERPPSSAALDRLGALAAFAGALDPDLAAHVRVVRERGVSLWGRPIAETFPAVPDADYRAAIVADVDVPFRDVSKQPVYYVLNWLRVLRFVADGAVLSKEEAGVWGMSAMPLHIEVVADALKLYRRTEPRESLHFDVEPLQAFLRACRARLEV
ncbi:aminoglycoside adenylyltransferase domain-containing protein [Paenibacillus sp.]|uniref:aminoglycoside adenylyltransferase domain-containing protein n=1 Tax=Paenibacillus sp. TaxID=58172 RepID=UPI00281248DC|nr:aminoglycoside adenylyltransferase domain-containing protein [Paenibacillus sp.]